jgi:hypothetical protein
MGYIIVGDSEKYGECLVSVIYGGMELAKQVLDRMLNNPTKNDLYITSGISNLRIEEDDDESWWME